MWKYGVGFLLTICSLAGAAEHVVLYSAIDKPHLDAVVAGFTKATGIDVEVIGDAESTKTTGLAERLEAEKDSPHADVWWSNEVFRTVQLKQAGVFQKYGSPTAKDVPAKYKDKDGLWAGVGLRVRVVGVTKREPGAKEASEVKSLADLIDPKFKGHVGLARPSFGTTGGQVAALYLLWGNDKADAWFKGLRANNAVMLGGNSVVADSVAAGTLWVGMTDNDDVSNAIDEDGAIAPVLPDQGDGGIGTLLMPTTVALVKGAPHETNAKKLIDYLLSSDVEKTLLARKFLAYSVRGDVKVKAMEVDYEKAAAHMPEAIERAIKILEGR